MAVLLRFLWPALRAAPPGTHFHVSMISQHSVQNQRIFKP